MFTCSIPNLLLTKKNRAIIDHIGTIPHMARVEALAAISYVHQYVSETMTLEIEALAVSEIALETDWTNLAHQADSDSTRDVYDEMEILPGRIHLY